MCTLLGSECLLERIIFILQNGSFHEEVINLRVSRNTFLVAQKVLHEVRERFARVSARQGVFPFAGFRFYTVTENERAIAITALTDFAGGRQDIKRTRLSAKRLNIFFIGANINEAGILEKVAGHDSRVFTW